MKKLNKKGFTLIELLAVIVIMGILMVVAIPAVTRTIENTRKDTYKNTASQYISQIKTLWAADGLKCTDDGTNYTYSANAANGATYYVKINGGVNFLLEEGGDSPWKVPAAGWLRIARSDDGENTYSIYLEDSKGHIVGEKEGSGGSSTYTYVTESGMSRSNVYTETTDSLLNYNDDNEEDIKANPAKDGEPVADKDNNIYICTEA